MHFSKTYAQLLVTLPPELRNNAFEYRKLKKLINQTVSELDSLGLGPSILQPPHGGSASSGTPTESPKDVSDGSRTCTIIYEIASDSSVVEPRLRLSPCQYPLDAQSTTQTIHHINLLIPEQSLHRITRALPHPPMIAEEEMQTQDNRDMIIPLPSDAAFFQLLMSTLSSLSDHLDTIHNAFNSNLTTLASLISLTARPVSSSAPRAFTAYSVTARNAMSLCPRQPGKSDLYVWREIFRLYTEAEVFESVGQSNRGERSVEAVEERFRLFEKYIQGEKASLILPGSRKGLDLFLSLNTFILDVKKFQHANAEATRKILKKHAKRTTLPIPLHLVEQDPSTSLSLSRRATLIVRPSTSLPRLLVQAIGEVLLPVIPNIDDYLCLICTSIAFKPIRLCCGHFFCVRCLAKMQKRRMANCPLCRAPTVLLANPSNVDYGLLNFMADWFPIESREKLHANEREVTREQMEELGIADARTCRIM